MSEWVSHIPGMSVKTNLYDGYNFCFAKIKFEPGSWPTSVLNGRMNAIGTSSDVSGSIFLIDGLMMLIGPEDMMDEAIILTPDDPNFRFELPKEMRTQMTISCVIPSQLNCFSIYTSEALAMYKLENVTWTTPQTLNNTNGVFLCITRGSLNVDGVTFEEGQKIDLTETNKTFTPVTNEVKVSIVKLKSQVQSNPVPSAVSPRQIRQALTQIGLRSQVEAAVAASDQNLKDWWEFATIFERNNPQVIGMGAALNVTTEQLDNLFILAATL